MASPQPVTSIPLVDSDLRPSLSWRQYLPRFDAVLRNLVGTSQFSTPVALVTVATPTNANAAAAGVAVGQLYTQTGHDPAFVFIRTA